MVDPESPYSSRHSTSGHSSPSFTHNISSNADTTDPEKANEPLSSRPSLIRTTSRADSLLSRVRSRRPIGSFHHTLSKQKTGPDVIVDFDSEDDPYQPRNWVFKKKVITTLLYGFTTMGSTWASSVFSPGIHQISEEFDISREVTTLGLALLLMGFGLGPLLWAPLSEVYGRKQAVLIPYFIAAIFSFGTATAKDVQTIMITRFFAGFFGSAPITNTGGVLGDIWAPEERGTALVGYAMAVVGGPVLGPIAGGAIVQSSLGWRWTEYVTGIMMLFFLTLDVLFLDESYPPTLLVYKARRLRHETGNWALHCRHEEWDVTFKELSHKYLIRPFQLLTTPICFLMALYASFVYGILYLGLGSFPIVFQEERGWNLVVGALPFLAQLLGILLGAAGNVYNQKLYVRAFKANGNRAVPEARLPPMMVGSVVFAAGLFIFGWTADKTIHWIAPCIGAVCMGFGFFTIFQACLNYLIDTFQAYAASAVAVNTFLRSVFASGFTMAVDPMFHNMGIHWACSLLGFLAVALIPIPYLFRIYGKSIRARGEWSRGSV